MWYKIWWSIGIFGIGLLSFSVGYWCFDYSKGENWSDLGVAMYTNKSMAMYSGALVFLVVFCGSSFWWYRWLGGGEIYQWIISTIVLLLGLMAYFYLMRFY